jgi:3-oxoacyl-[acyl-carrier protein] reductase
VDLDIKGHVAIVTGGARGLGEAMSFALAEEGCKVVVWDRDETAEQVATRIRAQGGEALGVTADVSDPAKVKSTISNVLERFGSIEILINCAGYSRDAPITEMTDQQWLDVIDVNLNAPFYVSRAVLPTMQNNHYGRIVNISSRARNGDNFKSNYSAAKAGVVGLTMALALELGKAGITVNAIAPGFCETERTRALPYYKDLKSRALALTPTDRLGTERDIADGMLYLVGKRSGYITGEVLQIAGGRWR